MSDARVGFEMRSNRRSVSMLGTKGGGGGVGAWKGHH